MKMIIVTCLNSRIWRLKLLRFTGRALDTKTLQLSHLTENGPTLELAFLHTLLTGQNRSHWLQAKHQISIKKSLKMGRSCPTLGPKIYRTTLDLAQNNLKVTGTGRVLGDIAGWPIAQTSTNANTYLGTSSSDFGL